MDPITRRDLLKQATVFSGAMLLGSAAASAQNQSNASSSQQGGEGSSNPNTAKSGKAIGSQGLVNADIDAQNTDSVVPPSTDHGNVGPFKYPFDFSHMGTGQRWHVTFGRVRGHGLYYSFKAGQ